MTGACTETFLFSAATVPHRKLNLNTRNVYKQLNEKCTDQRDGPTKEQQRSTATNLVGTDAEYSFCEQVASVIASPGCQTVSRLPFCARLSSGPVE